MKPLTILGAILPVILALLAAEPSEDQEYEGYKLNQKGDPDSAIYRTSQTDTSVNILPDDPDVYLNATVGVDEIRVLVDNLTAKVNLDAKVLDLLHFSAGVDVSIDRVILLIDDVYAKVELEARLGNLVLMVDSVLHSIDLNPVIASLGENVGKVVDSATDVIHDTVQGVSNIQNTANGTNNTSNIGPDMGQSPVSSGDPNSNNAGGWGQTTSPRPTTDVLYEWNDFSQGVTTKRIIDQTGWIVDVRHAFDGKELGRTTVGWSGTSMTYSGKKTPNGEGGQANGWIYEYYYYPVQGVKRICLFTTDAAGDVIKSEVLAEAS